MQFDCAELLRSFLLTMSLTNTHFCDILFYMIKNAHFNLISPMQKLIGNRHTPTTAPEPVRAFTDKCGTVRGQIKSPLMKKGFSPKATGNRQQATGNRQQATGNRQQATGNRQQATGNRQQATGNRQLYSFFN